MIKLRHLIPTCTYSSKYIPILINNRKLIFVDSKDNVSVNNINIDIEENNGFINMTEQIKKLEVGLNEESLNLYFKIKTNNNNLEEYVNITKSPYFYSIRYRFIKNNKTLVSRDLSNDNYNSKNFDNNFNYYINKYNFMKTLN